MGVKHAYAFKNCMTLVTSSLKIPVTPSKTIVLHGSTESMFADDEGI
jgi:hypothetical protein